jgi:beta-1,4-N-acetylglucosaminyltransferase
MNDKTSTPVRRKKILITLTGGGHLWEAVTLRKSLGSSFEYCYVTGDDCMIPENLNNEAVYRISTFATISEQGVLKKCLKLFTSIKQSADVLLKTKPDILICVGTSLAVPLSVCAKFFGKKVVFVESITRVTKPTLTGRILSIFRLVDRFYVQWPEAVKCYKGAIYKGTVL